MIDQSIAMQFNWAMSRGKADVLDALVGLLAEQPGVLDATLLIVSEDRTSVTRAATSNPKMFPIGGGETLSPDDPWCQRIMVERKPVIADGRAGLAQYLTDWQAIEAAGYGASGSFPVVVGGQVIGTINILAAQEHFTPERIVMTESILPFAALAFLIPSTPSA